MNCLPLSLKRLRGWGLGRSSFTGDARRYFRKVAGCGRLSLRGPLCCTGNRHGGGVSYACGFGGWMKEGSRGGGPFCEGLHLEDPGSLKGSLGVEQLTLWELCEGNLEWGLPCWGPCRICRKGSGDGHLFLGATFWGTWVKAHLLGTLRWMKVARWRNRLPLSLRRLHGGGLGRSSFTEDARRYFQRVTGCGRLSLHGPLRCTRNMAWGVLVCRWL
jgi:hypothetical protein